MITDDLILPHLHLRLGTSRRRLSAAPCFAVTSWTETRSKTCSCVSCTFWKACRRVGQHVWVTTFDFDSAWCRALTDYLIYKPSEALFTYWNKATPSELMDFFTLIEWVLISISLCLGNTCHVLEFQTLLANLSLQSRFLVIISLLSQFVLL